MIDIFKSLVDQATVRPAFQSGELLAYYRELGLESSKGMSINDTLKAIKEQISESIQSPEPSGKLDFKYFRLLRNALVYEMVILGKTDRKYILIAEIIRSSVRKNDNYREVSAWQEAINWAAAYEQVSGAREDDAFPDLRSNYPREVDTALAIKRLTEMGCQIEWREGTVTILSGEATIIDRVEEIISELGGINIIAGIFQGILKNIYNEPLKRYLFTAAIPIHPDHIRPATPYAYILNLAVKSPQLKYYTPGAENEKETLLWQELLQLGTDLLKVRDVQPYNQWEKVLRRPDDLINGLFNLSIYETATVMPQSSPDLEVEMLPVLFDWVDQNTFKNSQQFSIDEYVVAAAAITQIAGQQLGPVLVDEAPVKKVLSDKNLDGKNTSTILELMSLPPAEVNKQYRQITDTHLSNVSRVPLAKLDQGKYVMYDKSWCCMGFFQVLAEKVKMVFDAGKEPKHQHTDRFIGMGLERYIFRKLKERNVLFHTGKFKDIDGKDAECDCIIESSNAIIIIEVKKKQLTEKSRAGDMANLFLDLGASLLHSQLQGGKVELLLKTNGFIYINENGTNKTIQWKNREVLRISVTHYDYFGLQDRITAKQILSTFVERTIHPDPSLPPEIISGYKRLEKHTGEWVEQYKKLQAIDPTFEDNPFFSSWFLSVGQLILLLEGVNGNDRFADSLVKTKHISFSSNNFYYEHIFSGNLDDGQHGMVFVTPSPT